MTVRDELRLALSRQLGRAERLVRSIPRPPLPLKNRSTILALQYATALGYCVHATPVYEALKRQRPDVHLIVATHRGGVDALRSNPNIDVLLPTLSPFESGIAAAARSMRAELYHRGLVPDVVLTDASNMNTRTAVTAMLVSRAFRVGFSHAPALLQNPLDYDYGSSLIDNNLRLVGALGLASYHIEPSIFFSARELEQALSLVTECNPGSQPFAIFVTQGSGGQRTKWRDEAFGEVVKHVRAQGITVAYVGLESEKAAIERIRNLAGCIGISIAGRTSISVLSAVMCLADIVVAVDTGSMHVARAAGTPMVVLGPSWQRPLQWLPVGRANVRIVRGADTDFGAPGPVGYALDEITIEQVVAAIKDLIASNPAAELKREQRTARLCVGAATVSRPR